jgi:hypothetical protein
VSADVTIHPLPTDEEAAAIVAAYEALWPKPVVLVGGSERRTPPWRFSGRWWSSPMVLRRQRP